MTGRKGGMQSLQPVTPREVHMHNLQEGMDHADQSKHGQKRMCCGIDFRGGSEGTTSMRPHRAQEQSQNNLRTDSIEGMESMDDMEGIESMKKPTATGA